MKRLFNGAVADVTTEALGNDFEAVPHVGAPAPDDEGEDDFLGRVESAVGSSTKGGDGKGTVTRVLQKLPKSAPRMKPTATVSTGPVMNSWDRWP